MAAPGKLELAIEDADARMRRGEHHEAQRAYHEIWPRSKQLAPERRVWLLFAIANAAVRAGDFEDALAACEGAFEGFAKPTKIVVGNPLFHLLHGLAAYELGEPPERTDDAFARTMICGGPAMFTGEDPRHLARMLEILEPPAELGTWDGYTGCSRDRMNGATGYLAELLAQRLGEPPPYRYPDEA